MIRGVYGELVDASDTAVASLHEDLRAIDRRSRQFWSVSLPNFPQFSPANPWRESATICPI